MRARLCERRRRRGRIGAHRGPPGARELLDPLEMTIGLELQDWTKRLADADACFEDARRIYRDLIEEILQENDRLREGYVILAARLDERRLIGVQEPIAVPVARKKRNEITCLREGCGKTFIGHPNRKYCDDCQGERRREILAGNVRKMVRLDSGRMSSSR